MRHLFVAAAVIGLIAMATQAAPIAQWTFETSVPTTAGPHAPEVGSGSGIGFHTSASAVYSNPVGNGSNESFSSNFWNTIGDYYQFQIDSTGYSGLTFSWDQTRSGTGPSAFELRWSTDGSVGTLITSYTVPADTWTSGTPLPTSSFSSALPAGADNQATLYVRLYSTAAVATGGTNRVDNVTFTPEPMTLAFLGLGSLVMGLRRRGK